MDMAYLVIAAQAKEPFRQSLSGKAMTVGRALGCEIWLDDGKLSRRHFRIFREEGGWFIEDLQSTNGTWMDGERITRQRIGDGGSFEAGDTRFIFHAGEFIANRPRDPLEAQRLKQVAEPKNLSQETLVAHPLKLNGRPAPEPKPKVIMEE